MVGSTMIGINLKDLNLAQKADIRSPSRHIAERPHDISRLYAVWKALYPTPDLFFIADVAGAKTSFQKCLLRFDCSTLYDSQNNWQKDECPNRLNRYCNANINHGESEIHRITSDPIGA